MAYFKFCEHRLEVTYAAICCAQVCTGKMATHDSKWAGLEVEEAIAVGEGLGEGLVGPWEREVALTGRYGGGQGAKNNQVKDRG